MSVLLYCECDVKTHNICAPQTTISTSWTAQSWITILVRLKTSCIHSCCCGNWIMLISHIHRLKMIPLDESWDANALSESAISPAWLHVKRKLRSTLPDWLFYNSAVLSNDYWLINRAVFRLTVQVWSVALIGPLTVQWKSLSYFILYHIWYIWII